MTEVINDIWVPLGVRYGIPMAVFYKLNPKLMVRYQPYMNEWVKERLTHDSVAGWLAGSYVRDAIGSNFSKSHRYPDKPISFYDEPDGDEQEQFTDAERFKAFAAVFNKQFTEKEAASKPDKASDEEITEDSADGEISSTEDEDT